MVTFQDRIKELRTNLNLNQSTFSSEIGSNQSTLSAYESGDRLPPLETLIFISNKYNVSIDWLCGLSDVKSLPNKINTYSDLFMLLTYLCDIGYAKISEDDSSRGFVIVPHRRDDATSFYIKNDVNFNTFFEQWYKIHELYRAKTIDEDIYKIWLEKELAKYNFPINNMPPWAN